ncbi:MAG: LytTR family transcriptional regulator [Clostridia bacterium]|nr:LytTR family transcriptional regulator [Clostridia bacterium]
MKFELIIDPAAEEKVTVVARSRNGIAAKIEALIEQTELDMIGYSGKEGEKISLDDVCFFAAEGDKIFAFLGDKKLHIKSRLYLLEERLPQNFVKINQSCLANIKMITRFDASVSGTLMVFFKNGKSDYVSRRQLKHVKERLGI